MASKPGCCRKPTRQLLLFTLCHCWLQVVYPALSAKVKNVTLAYSVEHEAEVAFTHSCQSTDTCWIVGAA